MAFGMSKVSPNWDQSSVWKVGLQDMAHLWSFENFPCANALYKACHRVCNTSEQMRCGGWFFAWKSKKHSFLKSLEKQRKCLAVLWHVMADHDPLWQIMTHPCILFLKYLRLYPPLSTVFCGSYGHMLVAMIYWIHLDPISAYFCSVWMRYESVCGPWL